MKKLIALLFFIAPLLSRGQYLEMEATITCEKGKADVVRNAVLAFHPILNDLVSEGRLVNWGYNRSIRDEKTILTYWSDTQNEKTFRAAFDEYLKRASVRNPELFKSYAKVCSHRKDTVSESAMDLPAIKGHPWSAVARVEAIDEVPDPSLTYNVVVDFTAFAELEDSKHKPDSAQVNWGLTNIGRVYNLHVAAGVPASKINMVIAVHARAQYTFLNNESYRKRFKTDNPNLPLVRELSDAGIKFLVCGQSLHFFKIDRKELVPEAKVTLTAQTTLTSYQLKGYALMKMENQ